jgi:GTPase SAR1 family protein
LYEAKLLIVGEPGAGKTTLFKKLQDENTQVPAPKEEQPSTLGIVVKEGHLIPHPDQEGREIRVNLWDFGGQDIQYQLHQYFLTPQALYILVADNSKQNTRFDYWFQIIRLLGGRCRVLTILNNNRKYASKSDFDIHKYTENFPELTIKALNVDFSTNDYEWEHLKSAIAHTLADLPIVKQEVPSLWRPIRDIINDEKKIKKYVTIERFFEICKSKGLARVEDQLVVLKYFTLIGIILHFDNDINLRNIVFLNPNWITAGIYAVLSSKNENIENGYFEEKWIFSFWEKHENKYTYLERTYLLQLMLKDKFDICYNLLGSPHYIVPMLLPEKEPSYKWNPENNLHFRFQYPFMPEGIISRLIVRLNHMICNKLVWKKGAVFVNKNNCKTEVISKKDPNTGLSTIDIRVSGIILNDRKELLSLIRAEVEQIHKTAFEGINYDEMIVCNCSECFNTSKPHFYKLEVLQNYISKNERNILCDKSVETVSIAELMGAVYPEKEIDAKMEKKSPGMDHQGEDARAQIASTTVKGSNTVIALVAMFVSFALLVGTIVIFTQLLHIDILWFIILIISIILIYPAIWTYAVSPHIISEKGALQSFSKILDRLNILGFLLKKLPKADE